MTPAKAVLYLLGRKVNEDDHINDLKAALMEGQARLDEVPQIKEAMAAVILALVTRHDVPVPVKGMSFRDIEAATGIPKSTAARLAESARQARAGSDIDAINTAREE